MATLRRLSKNVLQSVAEQVAGYLPEDPVLFFGAGQAATPPRLHEYFPVVTIPDDVLEGFRKTPPRPGSELDLCKSMRETGLWHYQLSKDGNPTGYVQTTTTKGGTQEVRGVSITPESEQIDAALQSIDTAEMPETYEAVLLDLPEIAVAGVALVDPKNHKGSYVRVFRTPDPRIESQLAALPVKASDFILAILKLPRVQGASFE